MAVQYRDLTGGELCPALFAGFTRRQVVTKCWRREGDQWVIRDDPFIDDWSPADYETLTACLKNTLATGGFVHAAFLDGVLKGFVSVEKIGKVNWYTPLVEEEAYLQRESKSILQKLYRNSLKNFVTALYDGDALTQQDMDDLAVFLEEKSREFH